MPIRSLTLPSGLKNLHLSAIVAFRPSVTGLIAEGCPADPFRQCHCRFYPWVCVVGNRTAKAIQAGSLRQSAYFPWTYCVSVCSRLPGVVSSTSAHRVRVARKTPASRWISSFAVAKCHVLKGEILSCLKCKPAERFDILRFALTKSHRFFVNRQNDAASLAHNIVPCSRRIDHANSAVAVLF